MKKLLYILFIVAFGMLSMSSAIAKPGGNGGQMPPPAVQIGIAKAQQWQQEIQATGSLFAFQGIVVKPEISGRVTKIYFKSGQDVQQGTPLVSVNQDILQAQLEVSQANLQLRQQEFERSKKLYVTHAVATADLDTARANYVTAQAQVDQAEAQLKQAVITAPFSGRLGLRLISLGDYVTAGQNIVNLQALDPIVVNFSVPETYLNKIAIGDSVLIHCDSFPNQTFKGKVYAADSVIDPNTRTLSMRATIPNPDKKLLPGTFVEVTLMMGPTQPVVTIPQTALVSALDGTYVYKILGGKEAVKTKVTVAKLGDQLAYIQSGLKPGDAVITAGQIKITGDSSPVVVMPNG